MRNNKKLKLNKNITNNINNGNKTREKGLMKLVIK